MLFALIDVIFYYLTQKVSLPAFIDYNFTAQY